MLDISFGVVEFSKSLKIHICYHKIEFVVNLEEVCIPDKQWPVQVIVFLWDLQQVMG